MLKEPISDIIWDVKYRYRQGEKVLDSTLEATWQRVAKGIAQAEKSTERGHWQQAFYRLMEDYRFLPGGRILAGAGTKHRVTLFNCFVMDIAKDSLSSIFAALKEGALTLQMGGGVGYDFSVLRPEGELIKKTGLTTSGPISFMRIWDKTCGILLSTGARRGAMMGVMRCDHPDIQAFIAAKANPAELRHFNVSVMVTDAFMQAVQQDEEWPLIFPAGAGEQGEIIQRVWNGSKTPMACRVYQRIKARDLWQQMIKAAYQFAEPGVIFIDTINRLNNLWYREYIHATNPCGEIPLPAYGACDLGSINLTQFVSAPFSAQAQLDWTAIEDTVITATRFLDNVIDVSHYPLSAQRKQALGTRRIGLGLTGLADAFVMLGLHYGSAESIALANDLMKRIAHVTWHTSIELAREKGVFPYFQPDYLQGEFVRGLNQDLRRALQLHGVRNSHHNTIAPTGTISLLANNVSNGIEPIFKPAYDRHMRTASGETLTFTLKDYAYHLWQHTHPADPLPPAWIDTDSLSPAAHLQIQGAMQPYIDNAISKTINIPLNFPFAAVQNIYTEAYAMGLKGCTIFRPNSITGSVLEASPCCQQE